VNRWHARLVELQDNDCSPSECVQKVQNVQKSPPVSSCEHIERFEQRAGPAQNDAWTDVQEERAAIAQYDGGAPRAWAEALARLDPNKPPSNVPPQRWLRFINDCGLAGDP